MRPNLIKHYKTTVKTWILGYRQCRNSWNKQWKFHTKVKLDKTMHELRKSHEQVIKMGGKINQKSFKKSVREPIRQNRRPMWPKELLKSSGPWAQKSPITPGRGPRVPGRGKEFLPETPGSRFAIGKSTSCKQTSCKQIKSKALKPRRPTSHALMCWKARCGSTNPSCLRQCSAPCQEGRSKCRKYILK